MALVGLLNLSWSISYGKVNFSERITFWWNLIICRKNTALSMYIHTPCHFCNIWFDINIPVCGAIMLDKQRQTRMTHFWIDFVLFRLDQVCEIVCQGRYRSKTLMKIWIKQYFEDTWAQSSQHETLNWQYIQGVISYRVIMQHDQWYLDETEADRPQTNKTLLKNLIRPSKLIFCTIFDDVISGR